MTRYARWILRHRLVVILVTLVMTLVLGVFAAGLKIVIDPDKLSPDGHPLILSTERVEQAFGSKYLMLIGISPKQGDIFQPAVLDRIKRITAKLEAEPGVVKSTLLSLTATRAKAITGTPDGFEARSFIDDQHFKGSQGASLKALIASNPVYVNSIVSSDFQTAAILVELKQRSDGFHNMVEPIRKIAESEAGQDVVIRLGGNPVYHEKTEKFAERINYLFPIAILVIGLLHFEAFRTKQGLILPLVTALMAVVWGMGLMGVLGQRLDIFNSPTPILILAVAAGHAVQLLKRYYEEFETLRQEGVLEPEQANHEAVVRSLIGVGPVMVIAGGAAALGFFSLLVFSIPTIRTFGIFTGVGILSAVVLEMTFIPAVRSYLRPPSERDMEKETRMRIWDRIPGWLSGLIIPAAKRRLLVFGWLTLAVLSVGLLQRVTVDNSSTLFFAKNLDIQRDNDFFNQALGGTNSLYVMVQGKGADAVKDPGFLAGIENLQAFAASRPQVGKTLSIVDYLKRMNQAMHGDAAVEHRLPGSRNLISQYLLLYSMSGNVEDFNSWVDYDYKTAKITILLKTGSSAYVKELVTDIEARARQVFGENVQISFGGDASQTIALTDTMVKGKLMNIVQISLAVLVISALAFRSLLAGFLVLVPLTMSLLVIFGAMGALGIPLNIPNALISAMAVGIGADYAIYLLYRLRELSKLGMGAEDCMRQAMATAGKAVLFVATAVAGGYAVLSLSIGYNVHMWLSMFIVLAMLTSALTSLTVLPSLVLYLRPGFIFQRGYRDPAWKMAALAIFGSVFLFAASDWAHAESLTPKQIMQGSLDSNKFKNSMATSNFTLTSKDGYKRVRKAVSITRLQANGRDNMRRVDFLSPADIAGTSILLIEHADADDDMWIYLPALDRVRRLSAANNKDSFMGTDFSYGDIIGHATEQWLHRLVREEVIDGATCYVIESHPLDNTIRQKTGYSRRLTWVRKDNLVWLRMEFWDIHEQPLKRIVASNIKAIGQKERKFQAMRLEASNLQTGHRSVIAFDGFDAEVDLSPRLFRANALDVVIE